MVEYHRKILTQQPFNFTVTAKIHTTNQLLQVKAYEKMQDILKLKFVNILKHCSMRLKFVAKNIPFAELHS